MSFILNSVTLPRPKKFERRVNEISKSHITLNGETRKDIVRQKEIYILECRMLTQAQMTEIINIYNLKTAVNFEVTETNLTLSARSVWVNHEGRQYNTGGNEYREDITLVLEEV